MGGATEVFVVGRKAERGEIFVIRVFLTASGLYAFRSEISTLVLPFKAKSK